MENEFRRLLPRLVVDWHGMVNVEGSPEKQWRDCRVTDISSAGAGFELVDTSAEEMEGHPLFLAIHLRGHVRHLRASTDGRLRVGTEFTDLTDAQCAYLASLDELHAHW